MSSPSSSSTNPGPAIASSANTQSPRGQFQFIQTIAVSMTPVAVAVDTSAEQSFGANGATYVTAATGILPGDVLINVSPPSSTAGLGIVGSRVDTAVLDKFYIAWSNSTAGALTPPAGYYLLTIGRFNQSTSVTPATLSTLPSQLTNN